MGIIKRVTNIDYSQNAVGKYDFDNNIFRRKINGKLERNYISLNGGTASGFVPMDLSDDYYTVRTKFIYAKHSGYHKVFSCADYANKRSFVIAHTKLADGKIAFHLALTIGTKSYLLGYTYGVAPEELTDYTIEASIDFANKKFGYYKINGEFMPFPPIKESDVPNAWTGGQSRTVCFGQTANIANDTVNASRAYPFFGQVTDSKGNILVHYDFLGDNEAEILTDKARLDRLTNTSEVTIISKPLDL